MKTGSQGSRPTALDSYRSSDEGPKTARGKATRNKLLRAAEEVFGEKSYFEATVVDIVLRAGVGQGTFYVYFPSKYDIFRELILQLSRALRREIAQRTSKAKDRRDFERKGYEAFFDFVHAHGHLYRIVRQAEWVDPELFQAYYRTLLEGYMRGLKSARERGEVRGDLDLETLALSLMAMGDYLGMRWILWEGKKPPKRALDTLIALIFKGMDAPT
ncbi:MAG: TetR/AcrR family transcriptional regulator [Bacillota bacterium]|nr:TetR/AcrR family transcriptional regulator [Bacillota bacterium]